MFNYSNGLENIKPEEILIYLRKSRADDPMLTVEEVLSRHEEKLNSWINQNLSAPISEENRYRELVSGESITDRVVFQKVLKRIESPDIKAVLVVDSSRLGRPDTAEIGLISKTFRFTNTYVITPERAFNIADDFEREMFEAELKRGAFYLEASKKQLKRGRDISSNAGNYLCSKPLYGYDKITIIENKRKCPTLAINEEQANIVRMIFDWFVNENIGTQTICNRLNEMGVKAPEISLWKPDTIRRMLENPHYIGKVKWNDKKAVIVVDNGEFRKTRKKNKGEDRVLSKGKHEAIISEELFNAAQEKRGRTHRTCDNKELRNPLASILYCECGRAMSYRQSTRGGEYREARLVCNGQKYCGCGSCSVDEMLTFVIDILRQKIAEYEIEAKKGNTDSNKYHEKQIKHLEKKLSDLNAKELSLWEAQLDTENRMPAHIFQALTDKLVKDREETETALAKTRELITTPMDYEVKRVTLQKALEALLDEDISAAEKNKFLKECISLIVYHRGAAQRNLGKGSGRGYISAPIELDVKMKV